MELLAQYIDAKSKHDRYKKLEADLRIKLVQSLFPNSVEGTYNVFVDNIKVKAKFGLNITINQKKYDELCIQMTEEELDCVTLKPSLSVSKFKNLEDKDTLEKCVSISPAMPTVEIINEDI